MGMLPQSINQANARSKRKQAIKNKKWATGNHGDRSQGINFEKERRLNHILIEYL
jgi:hypothetical protein